MKVVFSAYIGSKKKHEVAYTVREQVNGLYSVFHGSYPIEKNLPNLMKAVDVLLNRMNIWRTI